MKIGGFIKCSLIDYPEKISAVIFTQGCNLRCAYCHNPQLVYPELFGETIPIENILNFLEKRKGLIDGVVICGGEPTLQKDLLDVIKKISSMGFFIKVDTNGSNPEMLEEILSQINYIAMDIKAPSEEEYLKICRVNVDFNKILKSISLIRSSKIDYEFRTTFYPPLMTEDSITRIKKLLYDNEKHIIQKYQKPYISYDIEQKLSF